MKSQLTRAMLFILYGCSRQNVYDSITYNRELECQKNAGRRQECMQYKVGKEA